MNRSKRDKKDKRTKRVRLKIRSTSSRPRLSVFRSNRLIYAQIIDDEKGNTILAASEKNLGEKMKGTRIERAKAVGLLLAKKAIAKKIKKVVFDRGRYKYHGRVKALAEGAREGGLLF